MQEALNYSEVPSAIDMAPYAPWYQQIVQRAASENQSKNEPTVIVEAGVRYGCSARIFVEALEEFDAWQLFLIDPARKPEAAILASDPRVSFLTAPAEAVASKFADESVDVLHIDADINGDHSYELALSILTSYWRKLKPNGEVIFHDCTSSFPGIYRLVKELEESKQWQVSYCTPDPQSPISCPALARRLFLGSDSLDVTVVVPVVQEKFIFSLLKDIYHNTVKPQEIIIIDNGKGVCEDICTRFSGRLPIRYLKQEKNLGVNASWNLGLNESRTELVSILNDDLVIPDHFFSSINDTFATMPRAGLVVPSTVGPRLQSASLPWSVGRPSDVVSCDGTPQVRLIGVREGWAFTLKKGLVDPIPSSMFTFCGDDWLFQQVRSKGYWTLKITNNRVFHYVGISQDLQQRKVLGLPTVDQDREAWSAARRQLICEVSDDN